MPRIAADSVPEHRRQLHRRIFDALAELMAERGYDGVTMAGLAERADLGRTAIYHHFTDKEAVLVAFATQVTDDYVAELRAALDGLHDPAAELQVYVRHQLEAGQRFHIGLGPALSGALSEDARSEIRAHVVTVEVVLRDILERGRQAGAFAYDDIDTTTALVHACLSPRHLPRAAVEDFVLHGVGAGGSGQAVIA